MFELNELELASVVGGALIIKNSNSGGSSINVINLPTVVNHGKIVDSNTSSGNTILQDSPTYTNYPYYPYYY